MTHIPDHILLMDADGELDPLRAQEVGRHLAACPVCHSRQVALTRELASAIEAQLDQELPPIDGARALLQSRLRRPARRQRYWAAAALTAAALLLTIQFLPPNNGGQVPRAVLTPGAIGANTSETMCNAGGEDSRPTISTELAREVFRRYGIHDPQPRAYEVDYLIPPDLGGTAEARNLWPQPYSAGKWNARVKDALEDRLHSLVCSGELDMTAAQRDIAADWIGAYKKYFQTREPLPDHLAFNRDQPWE